MKKGQGGRKRIKWLANPLDNQPSCIVKPNLCSMIIEITQDYFTDNCIVSKQEKYVGKGSVIEKTKVVFLHIMEYS